MKTSMKHKLIALAVAGLMSAPAMAAKVLKLSHNQSESIPVHKSMQFFADKVNEYTNGEIKIRIYPNATLGSQRESLELVQSGTLALAKSNAAELEAFEPLYSVFNLPYIFKNRDHYYAVLGGKVGEEILGASADKGFIGITYYDAGSRSFYGKKAFKHPDDLKGLKIRVQPSPTAVRMVELLGANPTPIAFGELYTALQQGVVDAAENNESALVDVRHGEVSKFYSYDEHVMTPDVLVISTQIWNDLTPEQKEAFQKAGKESMLYQKDLWTEHTKKVIDEAKEKLGVTFVTDVDKPAFEAKVAIMQDELGKTSEKMADLIKQINALSADDNNPSKEEAQSAQ